MKKHKIIESFDFSIRVLNKENQCISYEFNCGDKYPEKGLADYLKVDAIKDMEIGEGVTYLVIDNNRKKLAGYFTLVSSAMTYRYRTESLEDGIYECLCGIPAIRISMFAVDVNYQDVFCEGRPIASWILDLLISKVDDISNSVSGVKAIFLHSLPSAENFYLKNEFYPCEEYFEILASNDDDLTVMYTFIREVKIIHEKSNK